MERRISVFFIVFFKPRIYCLRSGADHMPMPLLAESISRQFARCLFVIFGGGGISERAVPE